MSEFFNFSDEEYQRLLEEYKALKNKIYLGIFAMIIMVGSTVYGAISLYDEVANPRLLLLFMGVMCLAYIVSAVLINVKPKLGVIVGISSIVLFYLVLGLMNPANFLRGIFIRIGSIVMLSNAYSATEELDELRRQLDTYEEQKFGAARR